MKTKIVAISILILSIFGATPALATFGIQTKTSHCVAGATPDTACSPGAVLTTDANIVCVSGYTKKVRDVTTATKKKVFKEYGLAWSTRSNYEVDHIISLELGGSNDISNLFPESYTISNGARVKDTLENYLHSQVCSGAISLTGAQKAISGDWTVAYQNWKNPKSAAKTVQTKSTQTTMPSTDPAVKKSTSGICHARGTRYYASTTHFTSYTTVQACLDSRGRLPLN
ncbi:HNH endonuclease [Candidatus Nomurabacteria bacterium]|nr:HNH endonuclease [Candidatus Nomurabacteria bacterium]